MARYRVAVNMEFVRSAEKGFRWGVGTAAELGYRYVEPMVHTGWEVLSEGGFFHSFSMEEDPLLMRDICAEAGVEVSALSAHSHLMKPENAVPRLTRAIVLADMCGARFVNTSEGHRPDWLDDQAAHHLLRYSLTRAEMVARRHRVSICLEPHGACSSTSEGLLRLVGLVESPWIGVNWDTGNAHLAGGEDPYEALERVRRAVLHVHAKDISRQQSDRERGAVYGTPVGCACGDGVVDWQRVLSILEPLDREIFFSVECGEVEEARRSLAFLRSVMGDRLIA